MGLTNFQTNINPIEVYSELSIRPDRLIGVVIAANDSLPDVEYIYVPSTNTLNLILPSKKSHYTKKLESQEAKMITHGDRDCLEKEIMNLILSEEFHYEFKIAKDENIDFEFINGGRMYLNNGFMHINEIGMFEYQSVTDLVVISQNPNTEEYGLVLIKRKKAPMGWAFAGGTVEKNESVTENAQKEIAEELGSKMKSKVIYEYKEPISTAEIRGKLNTNVIIFYSANGYNNAVAGDDAAATCFLPMSKISQLLKEGSIQMQEGNIRLIPHHIEILKMVIEDSKENQAFREYFKEVGD